MAEDGKYGDSPSKQGLLIIADSHKVEDSIWFYAPNKVAPILFTIFFTFSFIAHIWQCAHFCAWKFAGLLPWAALLFVAGYAMRVAGAYHYDNVEIFISSICLVYAAPPIYELANYVILGRILYYVPYHSPIHPGRVITTFGAISAVIEALNSNGAAYTANSTLPQSKRDIGHALLKAALLLQLVVLSSFVTLALFFHRRCKQAGILPTNLKTILYTLYLSSALLFVRTIYRTVEYWEIVNVNFADPGLKLSELSPMVRYEWFFWLFEGVLMLLNTTLLNVCHPARFLPRSIKVYLAQDGVTEIEGPGYQEKRPWWLTFIDPFDVIGLFQGKDKKDRFWETQGDAHAVGQAKHAGAGDGYDGGQNAKRNIGMVLLDPLDVIGRVSGQRKRRQQAAAEHGTPVMRDEQVVEQKV